MHLKKLRLINFRRFSGDHTIEFDRNLTVFAANNGAGKTSMLDAIALALGPFLTKFPKISGNAPIDSDVSFTRERDQPFALISAELYEKDENCNASVSVKWDRIKRLNPTLAVIKNVAIKLFAMGYEVHGLADIHTEASSLLEKIDSDVIFPLLAYYGTGRALIDVPQRRRGFGKEFPRYQAYADCLNPKTNFRKLFEYFYFLEDLERREITAQKNFDYRSPQLEAIRNAITSCVPEFMLPRTKLSPMRFVLTGKLDGREYDIKLLSDGYKTTISMVMDIALRMVELNPEMGVDALQTPGIVLIDEIELHLHPSWQQRILLDLRRTFPNIQFICTTHSPQVLSTVPSECIRTIDENGEIDNTPDTRTYGAESNRVLVELMHVKTRPKLHDQLVKEFIEITDMGDWSSERYQTLRNTLVHDLGLTDPAIIEADIKKNFQQLELE